MAGEEAMLRELEQRRANLQSPAKALGTELWMEFLSAKYQHLPCKNAAGKSEWTVSETMLAVDKDLKDGKSMTYEKWVGYWRRWMLRERWAHWRTRSAWIVRARARVQAKQRGQRSEALLAAAAKRAAELAWGARGTQGAGAGELQAKCKQYYSVFPAGDEVGSYRALHAQRQRKSDWKALPKPRLPQ